MQPQPLLRRELIALSRWVAEAQTAGLSMEQAIALVARRLKLDPVKVATLVEADSRK
jgi:hypothetical protein